MTTIKASGTGDRLEATREIRAQLGGLGLREARDIVGAAVSDRGFSPVRWNEDEVLTFAVVLERAGYSVEIDTGGSR